ncbi:MAG: response regulator [Bacteroidota bacterium]
MKKILIIEDDLIDQMSFARMFEKQKMDCTISIASSVKDAKDKLTQTEFDLIISDHNLPDGTTFDLIPFLRHTPLILITGNESKHIINAVIHQSGAVACFTKDLNFKYLEELPKIIHLIFDQELHPLAIPKTTSPTAPLGNLPKDRIKISIHNAYKIFNGKAEDIKETIEIFIKYKPKEMDDLYQSLQRQNCQKAIKYAHRMKSGFRLLGMKDQEELAEFIENSITENGNNCESQEIATAFKKLSADTKLAVDLLKEELARL